MSRNRTETLDLLHDRHDALVKAGEESLRKAYAFGNVVNALHGMFSYAQLGEELGRSAAMIGTYARLYRKYSTEQLLLATARAAGTFDVNHLANDGAAVRYAYSFVCRNCGSDDVHRERKSVVPDNIAGIAAQAQA
jgi:hypothetical protein